MNASPWSRHLGTFGSRLVSVWSCMGSAELLDSRRMGTAPAQVPLQVTRLRYESLAEEMKALLRSLTPGDRLPSERDLCARFGVSRGTLRRAMNELRVLGLVEAGARGWRVTEPPLGEPEALLSFSEMAARAGVATGSRILAERFRPATRVEVEVLGIPPGARVFELTRLRSFDGAAVGIEVTRLPESLAPFEQGEFDVESLYAFLRRHEVFPALAHYSVTAAGATPWEAALLNVEPDAPVVVTDATTSNAQSVPIEISRGIFRADRYRFRATLTASGPDPQPPWERSPRERA